MNEGSAGKGKKNVRWWHFLLLGLSVAALMVIIFEPHHPSHTLVQKYLSIVISWPAVVLTLGIILLIIYKDTISLCLKKLLIRTPGGYEIKVNQESAVPPDKAAAEARLYNVTTTQTEEFAKILLFWWAAEWLIRYMYRSQFRLLRTIEQRGYITIPDVANFYGEYLNSGGTQDYKMGDYIGWLADKMRLIEIRPFGSEYRHSLTELGLKFLDYCRTRNYFESEFKPL